MILRSSTTLRGTWAAVLFLLPYAAGQEKTNAQGEIHVLKVQGSIYMLVGGGANITVQAGPEGIAMVDSGPAESSEAVRTVTQQLSDRQVHYIINTAFDADHTGGNAVLAKTAKPIIGSTTGGAPMERGAAIIAEENVLNRMSSPTGQKALAPQAAWPTDTYFEGQKEIYFNGEAIQVMPAPGAHTDGDSIVYFRKSDVVSTGDIFLTTTYPVINLEAGGSINGVIDALNHILDIAIPAHEQEGGTMIIPGHGRLCDEHDVLEYRDMVTIVRDRVQTAIKKGMTLEQVKAAGYTKEYDPRYGAKTGPWTTDMFIEAVYTSLASKK